jgi:hypothetical protein
MLTIDGVLVSLILLVGIVGVVRGFLKELGVTLVMVATLWTLSILLPVVERLLDEGKLAFLGLGAWAESQGTQTVLFLLCSGLILFAAFISYQGETLSYEGSVPKGMLGVLLGFLLGAANGYLIFGTLWWIANRYRYPMGMLTGDLAASSQQVINAHLLPLDLLAGGVTNTGPINLLAVILIVLIFLKVIR